MAWSRMCPERERWRDDDVTTFDRPRPQAPTPRQIEWLRSHVASKLDSSSPATDLVLVAKPRMQSFGELSQTLRAFAKQRGLPRRRASSPRGGAP